MKNYLATIDDFYDTWDNKLIWAIKKCCTKQNKPFNEDRSLGIKVILLLVWYGIKVEDIVEIKLNDVSYEGIKGYDIQFDDRTLDTFMEYKRMNGYNVENGERVTFKQFKQDTFYRTTVNTEINSRTIYNAIMSFIKVEDEDKDLQNLYFTSNIYENGSYCYVYDRLGDKKPSKKNVTELALQFGCDLSAETAGKNYAMRFRKYYNFRQEWDKQNPKPEPESEQIEERAEQTDDTEVTTETTRVSTEEVKELVDNLANNPISTEHIEVPVVGQDNTIDICLNVLNGLRTSVSLISNQIDTLEDALRKMKQ